MSMIAQTMPDLWPISQGSEFRYWHRAVSLKKICYPHCFNSTGSIRPLVKECVPEILFSYFSTETYIVGTEKNLLDETVLLSTQNIC